eukprot:RCo040281
MTRAMRGESPPAQRASLRLAPHTQPEGGRHLKERSEKTVAEEVEVVVVVVVVVEVSKGKASSQKVSNKGATESDPLGFSVFSCPSIGGVLGLGRLVEAHLTWGLR